MRVKTDGFGRDFSLLSEETPAASVAPGSLKGKFLVPVFFLGDLAALLLLWTVVIGPNCAALWVMSLSWKLTAQEHSSKEKKVIKERLAQWMFRQWDWVFSNKSNSLYAWQWRHLNNRKQSHYQCASISQFICWDQWAGHHLLPENVFSSDLPPLRAPVKCHQLLSALISITIQFRV